MADNCESQKRTNKLRKQGWNRHKACFLLLILYSKCHPYLILHRLFIIQTTYIIGDVVTEKLYSGALTLKEQDRMLFDGTSVQIEFFIIFIFIGTGGAVYGLLS